VQHVKLQAESTETLHLATLAVRLGRGAHFMSETLARGAAVARQQIYLTFTGPDGKAWLRGASLAGARRHLDTSLWVEHQAPGCRSRERFKSVLDGEARSVFQGKIIVPAEAQKTDARMMMRALLLSETAEADMKPELEIYADDVQCGHGATAAALDEEQLFYLHARGIPPAEAEAMLITAFVGEILETIEHEPARQALNAIAADWLRIRD
jgi:Fe-S cluster assembly protein SufD